MALLPDLEDIPFLNPDYNDVAEVEDVYDDGSEAGSGDDYGSGDELGPVEIEGYTNGTLGQMEGMIPVGEGVEVRRKKRPEDPMDGWFPGGDKAQEYRDLFESLGCREHFLQAKPGRTEEIPKDCEKLLYSISFLTFQVHNQHMEFPISNFINSLKNPSLLQKNISINNLMSGSLGETLQLRHDWQHLLHV